MKHYKHKTETQHPSYQTRETLRENGLIKGSINEIYNFGKNTNQWVSNKNIQIQNKSNDLLFIAEKSNIN